MKNNKPILDPSSLIVDGLYLDINNQLNQIKRINFDKDEIHIFNISERYHFYIKLRNHCLVEKIR